MNFDFPEKTQKFIRPKSIFYLRSFIVLFSIDNLVEYTANERRTLRRSNKQNCPSAEWVQEQKNRKIFTYIGLYGLNDKTVIRIVKNYQENE